MMVITMMVMMMMRIMVQVTDVKKNKSGHDEGGEWVSSSLGEGRGRGMGERRG